MKPINLSKILSDLPDADSMELNFLNLSFTGKLQNFEASFLKSYHDAILIQIRIVLIVATLLIAIFGVLDALMVPTQKNTLWMIRYLLYCPSVFSLFLFSFHPWSRTYMQSALCLGVIISGLCVISMINVIPSPVSYFYYAGLMLTFMFEIILRLRFTGAALANLSLIISYEISAVWINPTPINILINNNFFFISAAFIGMIASYFMEYFARRNFFLTHLLKEAKENADDANRAKSEFLANMSHELRTPLNAVTGFSELLSSVVTDQKQKSYLEAIKTGGKSLLTLINDILDLSKIESGKMEIQCTPVNPRMIFNEIEQIFKAKIAEKNLDFLVDIDDDLPEALSIDETRLRQILLNFVGNSVKFTERGYIRLSAGKIRENEKLSKIDFVISVEDTGIGIPESEQKRIFDAFKQQKGQRVEKFGGTGLGLAICKRLIEIMNGRINVKSAPGEGTVFEILLKDVDVASIDISTLEKKDFDVDGVLFERASVLVVDDIESNRALLSELLSRANLDVLMAENGREAVDKAREYLPHVILMDVRMPVMNGIEATKRIKADPKTAKTPVIALTASASLTEKADIITTGLDGYLSKPVRMESLFEELFKHLKTREKTGPAREAPDAGAEARPAAPRDVENLPELIRILREETTPAVKGLKGVMKMSEIKNIGEGIRRLGEAHKARELIYFADKLIEFEQSFDIANIEKALKRFPGLVDKLEDGVKRFRVQG